MQTFLTLSKIIFYMLGVSFSYGYLNTRWQVKDLEHPGAVFGALAFPIALPLIFLGAPLAAWGTKIAKRQLEHKKQLLKSQELRERLQLLEDLELKTIEKELDDNLLVYDDKAPLMLNERRR